MAQLFGIDKSGISRHISNIFKEEELQQDTTVAKIATVVNRGIRGEVEELVDFYNLDMTSERLLIYTNSFLKFVLLDIIIETDGGYHTRDI